MAQTPSSTKIVRLERRVSQSISFLTFYGKGKGVKWPDEQGYGLIQRTPAAESKPND